MPFGQQSGPPATHRQVEELTALVGAAGYDGFREARHPLGLNQRQAAGRFTRDEADELIERLQQPEESGGEVQAPPKRASTGQQLLKMVPDKQLAAELESRGWTLIAPLVPE